MDSFTMLHEQSAPALEVKLAGCEDVRAAADVACRHLDNIFAEYVGQKGVDFARARRLCAVSRAALSLMGAVNQAQARLLPEKIEAKPLKIRAYLPLLPAILMAILAVWLFLSGDTNPALLALAAIIAACFTGRARGEARRTPAVEATPKADPKEVLRYLQFLFAELDRAMGEEGAPTSAAPMSKALLEPLQMLMEAQLQNDPDFALAAVPQLIGALEKQGVSMRLYTGERPEDFDLLPAMVGGETIRPAIFMGEERLLRGQATVKAS